MKPKPNYLFTRRLNHNPIAQAWQSSPNLLSDYEPARESWTKLVDLAQPLLPEIPALVRAELMLLRFDLSRAEEEWLKVHPQMMRLRSLGLENVLAAVQRKNPDAFQIIENGCGHLKHTGYLLECYCQGNLLPWKTLW